VTSLDPECLRIRPTERFEVNVFDPAAQLYSGPGFGLLPELTVANAPERAGIESAFYQLPSIAEQPLFPGRRFPG